MKVYLAGNMITEWRRQVLEAAPDIEWIEPARGDDWFERQCQQMEQADAILANVDMEARHIGTISELSAFRVMGKPRVLCIAHGRRGERGYVIAEKIASPGMVTTDLMEAIQLVRLLTTR